MSLLTWNDRYSVHVRRFDEDHQGLFGILNELHDGMKRGQGKEVLQSVLTKLLKYTQEHFAREEAVMKTYGYPQLSKQVEQHTAFVEKVKGFSRDYNAGAAALSVEVLDFLTQWLKGHIVGCDQQYSEFLNAKGVV